MREILFRGKRVDNGEWVHGDLVRLKDGRKSSPYIYGLGEVIPETIGQFTGLTDKNGNKIFEGDIVDYPKWVVAYCADTNESLGMNAGWYLQRDAFESWEELVNTCDHIVLGNIHDNHELLKGGE